MARYHVIINEWRLLIGCRPGGPWDIHALGCIHSGGVGASLRHGYAGHLAPLQPLILTIMEHLGQSILTSFASVPDIFRVLLVSTHLAHLTHPSPMLSRARIIFRKLRGSGSRGSEPAPSAPAMTAESETDDPPPRALHISDWRRSAPEQRYHGQQRMEIIVVNAKGSADGSRLDEVSAQCNKL